MRTISLVLASITLSGVAAAELRVSLQNAPCPGMCAVVLQGTPAADYRLFISRMEGTTPIDELITLSIDPVRQFAAGVEIQGTLDGTGRASIAFTASEGLVGGHLSFQAATTEPAVEVSNLCRGTFLAQGTFGVAAGLPLGLSFLGDEFPLAAGGTLLIGGAGPIVSTYDSASQEIVPSGLLSAGNLFAARAQLADGRVIVVGGVDVTKGQPSSEAFLYDPATGTTSDLPVLKTARAGATATRLSNGKVLVAGGMSTFDITDVLAFFNGILNSTELFDPTTMTFSPGPNMTERKAFATATVLNNNQVLVAGGLGLLPVVNLPYVSNTAYTYNPTTNTFGFLPKIFTGGRMFHAATKLTDGRVMLSGGINADLSGVLKTGDITQIVFGTVATTSTYATSGLGSFSNGPTLTEGRALHTATALPGVRMLVAGGISGEIDIGAILSGDFTLPKSIATSEIASPSSVLPGPSLSAPRVGASAISEIDGRVVVIGGGPLEVEIFQP